MMGFPLSTEESAAISARIDTQPELIVCAAMHHDGMTYSVERPGRHGDIINRAWRRWKAEGVDYPDVPCGFLTNRGRFVGRAEAREIALRAGQTADTHLPTGLFSEDMWNDPEEPTYKRRER